MADRQPRRAARVGLKGGRGRSHSLAERLGARTTKTATCWIVVGYELPNGYVQFKFRVNGKQGSVYAHRLAWELANGRSVPPGLEVLHACDTPRCVNPAHLSVGTHHENILDSVRKGRYNVFGHQKLNAGQVLTIRAMSSRGVLQKDIAAQFGIARHSVSGIVTGKSWAHLEPVQPLAQDGNLSHDGQQQFRGAGI